MPEPPSVVLSCHQYKKLLSDFALFACDFFFWGGGGRRVGFCDFLVVSPGPSSGRASVLLLGSVHPPSREPPVSGRAPSAAPDVSHRSFFSGATSGQRRLPWTVKFPNRWLKGFSCVCFPCSSFWPCRGSGPGLPCAGALPGPQSTARGVLGVHRPRVHPPQHILEVT